MKQLYKSYLSWTSIIDRDHTGADLKDFFALVIKGYSALLAYVSTLSSIYHTAHN